ncbi:MAG: MYG1 family protein [Rhabdochlamydiaceae bacterium]|nr:MYG1 family protein [Candidatus Amphrikana amoebophyrae]
MTDIILFRSFGTHNGTFHADEVTACALLIIFDLIDRDKIVRSRNDEELSHLEYVCDVGGIYNPAIKRFDHHQKEYQGELSSAGMILQYLRDEQIIDEGIFQYLRLGLVKGIDEIDNGLVDPVEGHATFSSVIANFIPISYNATTEEMFIAFERALDFVINYIRHKLEKYAYVQECKGAVKEEMDKQDRCLYFQHSMPWLEPFFEMGGDDHPAQFVLMPTGQHWKLRAIPPSYKDRMRTRKPLPKKWAGLLENDLKKASNIEGAIFCHKGRFISIWETKEDALAALKEALK